MIKPKKTIIDAKGYETPLFYGDFVLKLDFNENLIGPSPKVLDVLRNVSEKEVKFYPVYGELIKAIAKFNNVDAKMVLPTNGADEAISYIFNTFVDRDDEVLTVKPTFAMPQIYARPTGCAYVEVPYSEKWVFPIDNFLAHINEKTKLILITTPNSPTGEVISEENLLKVIETAKNSLVLIDETYANYTGKSYTHLLKTYNNVLITKSMSKDFAIAGLRLGYILSAPENIEFIRRIISPFSVNILAAKAGVAAINDIEHFEKVKNEIQHSKALLVEGLSKIADKVYPSQANFLCVDFGKKAKFIYKKLLKSGIKVKYFEGDDELDGCFRMAIPPLDGAKFLLNSLKKKEMIIFDMDGVLIDTSNSYRMAIKQTFEFFANTSVSFEEIQKAKNTGGLNNDWDLTEYLLKKSGMSVEENKIIDKFQQIYFGENNEGLINHEKWLIRKEMLIKLSKYFDLAVFTGRPRQEALFALKNFGVSDLFEPVITMDDLPFNRQKPFPDGINTIIDIVNPQKVYYLGDTPDDMTAAKSANVEGIGILPPHDKSLELKKLLQDKGAVVVLESTEKIFEYIGVDKCVQPL
ncbi:MAG: aminotransferase class I/II-fold pyridoxal phosphate-dependent enzyme [Candidatus Gastranaerophilaceae bacterium]|jgi:histidinol-phosphate aminotransferase